MIHLFLFLLKEVFNAKLFPVLTAMAEYHRLEYLCFHYHYL